MIEVEHLNKNYGELEAVKNLNFKVKEGEIWGLLGPNAAGKTTTMRILTGYLPATDGKATVGGFDVFDQPNEVKKIMGYLPEVVPLYSDMAVDEYLRFVAEIKQIPPAKRKEALERAIETAGLEVVRRRLIKNISRGFKQRVGIAQALIHDPQVLILDEPTIGLDPAQIIEIRQLVRALKGERTIMLSTHILAEVTQTCDGVVIIRDGRLMASGSLDELTASVKDKERMTIKLKSGGDELIPHFMQIPGTEKVSRKDGEFEFEWSPDKDIREDVAKFCVEKKLGLIEMRPQVMSIEDLYLKIVSGDVEQ